MEWLVLAFSFRGQGASTARVGAWRRLKRFGAVSPRHGLWVLPRRTECIEAAQWLSQEVEHGGGEALVMTVSEFDGLDHVELVALFREAAATLYRPLLERIAEVGQRAHAEAPNAHGLATTVARLEEDLAEARRVDYYDAPEGQAAALALRSLRERMNPAGEQPSIPRREAREYQGRTWVTRPRPYVDRLACAWLIRRFIDPRGKIRYRDRPRASEVAFDLPGGDFEHVGPLCTFEVMLQAFGLDAPGFRAIADIVHEIDLRDGQALRPEIAGVEAILSGWLEASMDDAALEAAGIALFDGLGSCFAASGKGLWTARPGTDRPAEAFK